MLVFLGSHMPYPSGELCTPNARHEPLPEAGAQRTLFAAAW